MKESKAEREDRELAAATDCSWCGGACWPTVYRNRRDEAFCSPSHRSSSNRALKRLRGGRNCKPTMARDASIVRVRDSEGYSLILLRAATMPTFPLSWGFPGGGIEPGESPAEAVVRELAEEAGLHVPVTRPNYLWLIQSHVPVHVFDLTVKRRFVPTLSSEHTDYRWARRKDVPLLGRPIAPITLGLL